MAIEAKLRERSGSKCELCSSESNLKIYEASPEKDLAIENSIIVCDICLGEIEKPDSLNPNHWHCLNESMWSEFSVVQVISWRILKRLSDHIWAQDLLEQLYLDEENLKWAQQGAVSNSSTGETSTKDSNGNLLNDGDSVTLIKDLVVKGAGFTAKRGTLVKNISLSSNPEHIEGKVNGTQIVLLTCYLKKV